MLSGELNRQVLVKRKLAEQDITVKKVKPGPAALTPIFFKTSPNILVVDDKVEVNMPGHSKGFIWDTWESVVNEYDNSEQGHQDFIRALTEVGTLLDNRIDKMDGGLTSIQSYSTSGTALLQFLQTLFAGTQWITGESYTDYQISLSTVLAGLSLLVKYVSSKVTDFKTDAINLKTIITAVENSQDILPPAPSIVTMVSVPLTIVNEAKRPDNADLTAPAPLPGAFVPVQDGLVINGSKVETSLPVQGSGCLFKSWSKESAEIDNTQANYNLLVKTLFSLTNILSNESTKCDRLTTDIQSFSSFGTAIIGVVQTAVAGVSIGTPGLEAFQIAISLVNGLGAIGLKAISSAITDTRNKTLTYSSDAGEILAAQLKR